MNKEIKEMVIEENGIRQITKASKHEVISSMFEIETGKEILRTKSTIKNDRTDVELIDFDFWDITIDDQKAEINDLKSLDGGPFKILALMNDRTIQIVTDG